MCLILTALLQPSNNPCGIAVILVPNNAFWNVTAFRLYVNKSLDTELSRLQLLNTEVKSDAPTLYLYKSEGRVVKLVQFWNVLLKSIALVHESNNPAGIDVSVAELQP